MNGSLVVLELLFSTGVRVSELCKLSRETVTLSDRSARLLIDGKGRKERVIQIETSEIVALLEAYCREFGTEIGEHGALLVNDRGRPMEPQSVRRIIVSVNSPVHNKAAMLNGSASRPKFIKVKAGDSQ